MKALTRTVFCCLLAAPGIAAQRGGMGHGGFGGGGFRGGFGGGGFRGGFGGFHGGFRGGGGFRGNRAIIVNRGFGFGRRFVGVGFWGWPAWGWGGAYYGSGGYDAYGYAGYAYGYGGYPYGYGSYPPEYAYGSSPNVVVVYPQQQPAAAYYPSQPALREYNEYGQEIAISRGDASAASPTYLIALKNNVIFAAMSYSVRGDTIYFVTLANEQKSAPLMMVDRDLSMRLNWERHVNLLLP